MKHVSTPCGLHTELLIIKTGVTVTTKNEMVKVVLISL